MLVNRFISTFLATIILLSSLGATGYERYCGCSGEIYSSLFFKSKSECCEHKPTFNKSRSCCSIKIKSKTETSNCSSDKKKCCDTKVKYSHLDEDATLEYHRSYFNSYNNSLFDKSDFFYEFRIAATEIFNSDFLSKNYKKLEDTSPPIKQSALTFLESQIIRC